MASTASAFPDPAGERLGRLATEVAGCRRCPRLRLARAGGQGERAAFRDQDYWGRLVPGFGDSRAGLLVLGLAPAAHGGNPHRAGSSPATAPATGCSPASTAPASPTSRPRCSARRRPGPQRLLHHRPGQVRPARQQAPPSATPAPLADRRAGPPRHPRRRRPRLLRLGPGPPPPRPRPPQPPLHPRRRGHPPARPGPARLLPRQPAEHEHRPPDRADAGRGVLAGMGAVGGSATD